MVGYIPRQISGAPDWTVQKKGDCLTYRRKFHMNGRGGVATITTLPAATLRWGASLFSAPVVVEIRAKGLSLGPLPIPKGAQAGRQYVDEFLNPLIEMEAE
jgi:hypothetical protein